MKSICTLFIIMLINVFVYAQKPNKTLSQLKAQTQAQISVNEQTGLANFIKFPVIKPMELKGRSVQEKAFTFLNSYKSIYNIKSLNEDLKLSKVTTDNYGFKHAVLKQYYKGVPVFGAELRFHFNAEKNLSAINGDIIPEIKVNPSPVLSQSEANITALNLVEQQKLNRSGVALTVNNTTLYVFAKGLVQGDIQGYYLVYEVEVRNATDVREFLYINAHNGELVEQFTGMAHALQRQLYDETFSNLIWTEGDAFPGDLNQWEQNELVASEHVYNFFNNAFGYVSYNGADAVMRTINNNPDIDCPNANWNGVTANYCDGTAADDVVAHEWGHAYTEYTCGLIYAYQSGAINESLSDIWGETIDILNNYEDSDENIETRGGCFGSQRWKIGEDAVAFGGAIRDMWLPFCNNDPGNVTASQYACGEADDGGVHTNSGVPNHAYALLVDGGVYNGQVINSIGFTKAAHIFWRAQSVYLTPTSNFVDLANALEVSAIDLIGINLEGLSTTSTPAGLSGEVISSADVDEVLNAILAVEMRTNPDACGYEPILAASDPLCAAATTGRVFYEDWEAGMGGWTVEQLPSTALTWMSRDWVLTSNLPDERAGSAMFGADPIIGDCVTDLENGIIRLESPEIVLPNFSTGTFNLAFNHYISTETDWDGGNIKYSIDGSDWTLLPLEAFTVNGYNGSINLESEGNDNPMQGEDAYTGSDGGSVTGSWGQSVVDLSVIGAGANSKIKLRWEMGTDGCNGRLGWYLDEVVVYNCTVEVLAVNDSEFIKQRLRFFPNPSNGIFTLQKTSNLDVISADVYDINGRLVKRINLEDMGQQKTISLEHVASGVYFMDLRTKKAKTTLKLIRL